ncbi:MAG: hypothetical protein ACREX6_11600, partial [Casimicrobiaceae bacterium]
MHIDSRDRAIYAVALSMTGDEIMSARPLATRTSAIRNVVSATLSIATALALGLIGVASAQQPTPAQQSAIKSTCRGDYQAVCAGVQPGGPAALQCLQENAGRVSPGCQHALAAIGGAPTQSAPTAPAGAASAPAEAAPMMAPAGAAPAMAPSGGMMPMSRRDELRLTRQACGSDYRQFCQGVQSGGGHAITCLEANAASLSPGCRQALGEMKGRAAR